MTSWHQNFTHRWVNINAISRQGKLPKDARSQRLSCLPTSIPTVASLRNRTAGRLRTAEWRKKCRARLCIPDLTGHVFVILPSCSISSLVDGRTWRHNKKFLAWLNFPKNLTHGAPLLSNNRTKIQELRRQEMWSYSLNFWEKNTVEQRNPEALLVL